MAICSQLIFYYRNRLILNGRTQVTGLDKTFLRAEGYSRRCRYSEFVAAKRHLNPKRTANCRLRTAGRQALNSTNDLRRTDLRRGLWPSFPGNPEIYEIAEDANL